MAPDKFRLAKVPQLPLRADAQVFVLRYEKAELVGKVQISLVVGGRREQDALAFVLLDVFLDGAVTLPFMVAEIVALVNHDEAESAEIGHLAENLADRHDPRPQPVLVAVVLPHTNKILGAEDESLQALIVFKDPGESGSH